MIISGVTLKNVGYVVDATIVTSGLTYYIDIGNTTSYSGTGSSVNDLSGSGLGASTLYNTPSYTSAGDASYLSFDGSTQYMYTPNLVSKFNSPSNTTTTIEAWAYAASDNGVLVDERGQVGNGWQDSQLEIVSGTMNMRIWNAGATAAGTFSRTKWNHCVLTYDGTTIRTYLNNVAGSTASYARQAPWVYGSSPNNNLYYALFLSDITNLGDGSSLSGRLGQFRVYTRALTATEVDQNFQATRSRYGV